jgi:hypothetical protein
MSIRILADARERVRSGWRQGGVAQDASGHTVPPSSPDACRWSVLGALLASRNGNGVSELAGAVRSLHSCVGESALEVWNDRPWRTQQEVVVALERAMGRVTNGRKAAPSADEDLSGYWLSTCEGFRVESNDGRVGIVEEIRFSPNRRPEALAVRTGLFRTRLLLVPIDDVREVTPRTKRVLVRSPAIR